MRGAPLRVASGAMVERKKEAAENAQMSLLAGETKSEKKEKVAVEESKKFGSFSEITSFIWSIADLMRGDFRRHEYGQVILPFTVLRRLDCVLAPNKAGVLAKYEKHKGKVKDLGTLLGQRFYNVSKLDLREIVRTGQQFDENLMHYIEGFDDETKDIFLKRFRFQDYVERLEKGGILLLVLQKFVGVDLHPDKVDNHTMGSIFEELIRKFAEVSNETAGEHFTPRDVVKLMVDLLFAEDEKTLRKPGIVRTLFDPACGTGGMLSVAQDRLAQIGPKASLEVFGQELNDESFAICKSDMMIKGQSPENVKPGNSFTEDGHRHATFHYMLSNPPFGVEWKKIETFVKDEHEKGGGRFDPGLPRINDGSLLFLMHMISKMKSAKDAEGSRIGIVFNGSPLFTGAAGSGESEIRRWILENDWLEAIVALPDQLFYNTGISTYVWLVTNRKRAERRGKVQLIDASDSFAKMRKSLGDKRKEITDAQRAEIVRLYQHFEELERSKIFDATDFGYRRITVERPLRLSFQTSPERIARLREEPAFVGLAETKKRKAGAARDAELAAGRALQTQILTALETMDATVAYKSRPQFEKALKRALDAANVDAPAPVKKAILNALSERDETAELCTLKDGRPEPDPDLRDTEHVPLKEDIHAYFDREVKPHVPDAWIDEEKTKVGYEIPFTRFFYKYTPPRPLAEIEADIKKLEAEIQGMLGEVLS
jgi:type I restriction enzyme M protein